MPGKLNLVREDPDYYSAGEEPRLVDFGRVRVLSIGGRGAPGREEFRARLRALYSVAYKVKSLCKREGRDFVVPKLEAVWKSPRDAPREEWEWELRVRVPDFVGEEEVEEARRLVSERVELAREVRLREVEEGLCIQALHVGPYGEEDRTVERIREFAEERGLELIGPHHEVYISDPRRTPEERLRTILRYRVRRRG